ncbi:MAG: AAA family ATPase [Mycobacteriales bacterium]
MTTVVVESDTAEAQTLSAALGAATTVLPTMDQLRRHLESEPEVDAVVVGPGVDKDLAFAFAQTQRLTRPTLGVVLVRKRVESSLLREALRAGVREVVAERDLRELVDAVRSVHELARKLRQASGDSALSDADTVHGKLVTVFSSKGGCGKTTLATNLAAALADGGRREVCLVDLDLAFGDVAIALQLFPAHTLADAIPMADSLDDEGVLSLITPHSPGLSTLVAPMEPGISEGISADVIARILSALKRNFSYVVVDSPPAFTDHVLAALDESDVIALLTTLDIPALKNLKLSLEALDLLNYPRERWRVVLNRADSKVGLVMNEVEKTLRVPIAVEIPSSRSVPASINRGVPIVLDEPNHPVSLAIKDFAARNVLSLSTGDVTPALPAALRSDRRGLLRRKAKHA